MKIKSFANAKNFMALTVALLFILSCGLAVAQTGSSSIRGLVTDPQGRPVMGATVTLANDERNFSRTQTTSEDGGYLFSAVPPGTYHISVEVSGFKKASVTNLQAQVDTPSDVDVQLEVGNVSETVTVSSSAEAPLNTTDATIGNTFESRRIAELPLNARNVVGLLSLQPGELEEGQLMAGEQTRQTLRSTAWT